jgi:hypothetical protein
MNTTLKRLVVAARAVADVEPARIEATVLQFSGTRRWLAPVAWATGTLVLVVRGVKLLILNWRLTMIELIPAVWVWVAMWDLKQHRLRAEPLRQLTPGQALLGVGVAIAFSVAAFWFNTVFGFAITHQPPRIGLAWQQARPHLRRVVTLGTGMGIVVAAGLAWIPRIDSGWLFLAAAFSLYGLMLVALVVVPARILGVIKQRMTPKQTIGRWAAGGALSAVAMTPGFVLDRVGIIMLGIPGFHLLGLVVLSIGTALYAAGLSSVKAIKLSMKLETR